MNIHLSDATQRKTQRAVAELSFPNSSFYLVLHQPRFTEPPRLLAMLVGSYPTVSPSPPCAEALGGSLFSVALSLSHLRLSLRADLLYGVLTFLHRISAAEPKFDNPIRQRSSADLRFPPEL